MRTLAALPRCTVDSGPLIPLPLGTNSLFRQTMKWVSLRGGIKKINDLNFSLTLIDPYTHSHVALLFYQNRRNQSGVSIEPQIFLVSELADCVEPASPGSPVGRVSVVRPHVT